MNQTLETIQKRFACRNYTGEPLPKEALEAIALAAVEAPSAVNRQGWRVIVVTNPGLLREMEEEGLRVLRAMPDPSAFLRIQSRGGVLFYHAPCIVFIAVDASDRMTSAMDCGIVCENIALAATSLGLGNVICGLAGLIFSGEKADYFKKRLGFPEGFEFGCSVLLGTAAKLSDPHTPDRGKIRFVE